MIRTYLILLYRIPQLFSRDFQAKYLIQSRWAFQGTSAVLRTTPFYKN